jgi:hypothetical protein
MESETQINEYQPPDRIWVQDDFSYFQTAANGTYYRDPDSHSLGYVRDSILCDLKQRTLSDGPCFCVYDESIPLEYFENEGAKTGHDNGFRHSSECLAARAALGPVPRHLVGCRDCSSAFWCDCPTGKNCPMTCGCGKD